MNRLPTPGSIHLKRPDFPYISNRRGFWGGGGHINIYIYIYMNDCYIYIYSLIMYKFKTNQYLPLLLLALIACKDSKVND